MNEIKERPNCQVCNNEPALIMYGTKLVCGHCAVKLDKVNQEFQEKFNRLKDDFIMGELKKYD
jgi:hypothetical protein